MKLTRYSDYALRLCLHLASQPERKVPISAAAEACGVPQSIMMKLVTDLVTGGFVTTTRGRSGGVRIAGDPSKISIARIVRHTEGPVQLVDCASCPLQHDCGLICVLAEAKQAFFAALERYSLADVVSREAQIPALSIAPTRD